MRQRIEAVAETISVCTGALAYQSSEDGLGPEAYQDLDAAYRAAGQAVRNLRALCDQLAETPAAVERGETVELCLRVQVSDRGLLHDWAAQQVACIWEDADAEMVGTDQRAAYEAVVGSALGPRLEAVGLKLVASSAELAPAAALSPVRAAV